MMTWLQKLLDACNVQTFSDVDWKLIQFAGGESPNGLNPDGPAWSALRRTMQ
jgi:hypothetical protein